MAKAGTLSNPEWKAVKPLLVGSHGANDRRIVGGIRFALEDGHGWRSIPGIVGNGWTTFYNRYRAWDESGLWRKIERALRAVARSETEAAKLETAKPTPVKAKAAKAKKAAKPAVRPARRTDENKARTARKDRKTRKAAAAAKAPAKKARRAA